MDIKFKINQFEKFYHFLTKNSPEGYIPWFFPCDKEGKNPSPSAILKIDPSSRGSWHHVSARLSKEQCIEHIKQGYNLGISAREGDKLIIGDIDEPEYMNQLPEDTLTSTSRKRCGGHFFGWDKDGSAKINLPTEYGELRSNNQYVLSPGSYVPFNLENEKDKKAFDKLPEEAREDKLLGYYTVEGATYPKEFSFDDLPKFFKDKESENIEEQVVIKDKDFIPTEGKYSELFRLKVSDIVGLIPANKRTGHPLHESDTDANFSLSKDGTLGHCWRHLVSLNAVQYLCTKVGYRTCGDCGTPHKGRGLSKIKGDKEALKVAYDEAVKMGLIKDVKVKRTISNYLSKEDLAKEIWKVQPYFYDKARIWWLWDNQDRRWERVDDKDILNMVSDNSEANTVNSREKNEIIESMQQYGRRKVPKKVKPTWIQFKSMIVDIQTGEEFLASPEYFSTNPIPFELDTERFVNTPTIDKIFEEWVGKDYVQTLYEIISYCLIPSYPLHRIFCFIGAGLNGKSKFLELLRKFIGEYNCCSTELDVLLNSRFEVTRLYKKLVCQMGETNFSEMSKTSMLKKLSGGDLIGFEYKGKDLLEDINYAKILISTNTLPATTDKTIGFYRRWLIVDFPNQFSEKKDILGDIPEEEYNCLAVKCLGILKDLLEVREFHKEGSVEDRIKKYEEKSNPLDKFISEFYSVADPNAFVTKNNFFNELNKWLKANRFREITDQALGKQMVEKGFENTKGYMDWWENGNCSRKQVRIWKGIKEKGGNSP